MLNMQDNADNDEAASPRFFPFTIGKLQCAAVSDGFIPTPASLGAPEIDADELAHFLIERGEDPAFISTPVSCLLIEREEDGGPILIDSGMGTLAGPMGDPIPSLGKLPSSLAMAGRSPEDIRIALLSHIHPDHFGGYFRADGHPNFPNAKYHVSVEEIDFWSADKPDLTGTLMPPPMRETLVADVHRFLDLAGPDIVPFKAGDDVLPGVGTILLDGHTPGQVGFLFDGGGGRQLFYTADAAGHPYISIERPDWRFSFDADAPLASRTRKRLIAMLIEKGWYSFTPHFPWPSVGRLSQRQDRVIWSPITEIEGQDV